KHLEDSVVDPVLRERLRPSYRAACKRLVISGEFYRAIQHSSAKLVTEPIAHVEAAGVRTRDGALHGLDVLALATGFRADRFMRPMHVLGRGGTNLDQLWADRPQAYLTVSIPGFPNLFMLNGPSSPVGNFSLIDAAEVQLAYIMQLVEQVRAGRCRELSASTDACARFNAERCEAAKNTIWSTGCRSWYLDDRGVPTAWPWSFQHFRDRLRTPDLDALELVS
ncbi:MAG: NAD(P)/FAD-dependent oxidoreductase, partial [Polyangiales bacterium]